MTAAAHIGPAINGDFRRMVRISFAIHFTALALYVFFPRSWFETLPRPMMTISLGGGAGQQTTGMTPIAGREIEKAEPPPKRPEPVKPTPPAKPDVMKVPAKTTPPDKTKAAEKEPPAPPPAATRPPTTGAEVRKGASAAETGAVGQSPGLQVGGGAGAEATLPLNFCCPEYAQAMVNAIEDQWKNRRPGPTGVATISFTIHRDGSISNIEIAQSSGNAMLDIISRAAVRGIKLPPLPREYTNETLTILLKFPYKNQ
jgi:protein TonB